jgi:hypothetical protein
MSNLNLIDKIDRHSEDHKGDAPKHNLAKALRHYEEGFNRTEGNEVFRYIFNGIEDAVNYDRHRPDDPFDKELGSIANVSKIKATQWRRLYNRIKHPDHIKHQANQLADYYKQLMKYQPNLFPCVKLPIKSS